MNKRILPTLGAFLVTATGAQAQTDSTADLRKELDALRGDYEKRISQLENRIHELESDAPPSPTARTGKKIRLKKSEPTTENAAIAEDMQRENKAEQNQQAAKKKLADETFKEDTEIRHIARRTDSETFLAERIDEVLEGYLDISGYFRAGYGRSDEGGPQRAFGIPGVAKYRLGNETENYGELAFAKTFYPAGAFANGNGMGPNDPVARMNYRMAFVDSYKDYGTSSDTNFSSPELWASLANVIPGMPDAKIWAGNRFYRRHDMHINDFYFWDMSGGGAGIEDVALGNGKLSFAWIGDGAQSSIYGQYNQPDSENLADFSKTSFDLRYYDWKFLGGKGEVGLVFSSAKSGVDVDGNQAEGADGFALNLVRTDEGFLDPNSLHKLSLQIGNGPAKTFTSGFDTFSTVDGTFIRPDPAESWRFRATDQVVIKPLPEMSLGSALVYQYTDFGDGVPTQTWLSGGVRPIWHISDVFSIALEGGVDWVSDALNGSGEGSTLGKITLAPQFALGSEFLTRPVLRGFITYATWSDDLQGSIGGADYADKNSGWSWGVQMETWW